MKSKANYWSSLARKILSFLLALVAFLPATLHAQDATLSAASTEPFFYLKVQLEPAMKPASLKSGDLVEGKLIRSVYWRDKEVFPAGSHVSMVVDRLEQRRRAPNDHWPWVIKAFGPRHEKYPVFRSARVLLPDARTFELKISLLSIGREVAVRAKTRKKEPTQRGEHEQTEATLSVPAASDKCARKSTTPNSGLTANLQAFVQMTDLPADSGTQSGFSAAETTTVPAGTQAKVVLLDAVSASGSHLGDTFHARLIEPVSVSSTVVLPAGSVLEGKVAKAQRPRMMSRAGSLLLSFTSVSNSDGTPKRIDASVAGLNIDRRSQDSVGPEGQIQGGRPGAAWTLINLGVTGGLAKAADDGTQLVMQAIISAATDASTAGTSRIVAACVSGVFMLTRHGRDVVLPKFTEIDITFNRPVVLSTLSSAGSVTDREPAQYRTER